MIRKKSFRLFQGVILALVLFTLCACGNSEPEPEPEPGVYEEQKGFVYNSYFLQLDEEGRFAIDDMLCRHNGNTYVLGGTYYLYESELILISNHKDVELVFAADGDNWVFNQKESTGTDLLKFNMEDKAIWVPWGFIDFHKW